MEKFKKYEIKNPQKFMFRYLRMFHPDTKTFLVTKTLNNKGTRFNFASETEFISFTIYSGKHLKRVEIHKGKWLKPKESKCFTSIEDIDVYFRWNI